MKTWRPSIVACAVCLFGTGIAAVAADKAPSRKLIIYSPHGPEMLVLAREELKRRHPTAELDWQFMGAEEVIDRLRREKASPVADIWWGGPQFTFIRGAKEGLLKAYKPSWSGESEPEHHDDGHRWYADLQTPVSIVFQKKLAKPLAVNDWDDLLGARFKQKLVVRYPMASGTMRALYTALIDRQLRHDQSLDQAFGWMKRLEGQVARYTTHSQIMFQTIGKGILSFGFWNVPEILMKEGEGYPVDFAFPSSGMPVILDCIALVDKKTPHPLAKEFYELVTSREFALKLSKPPYQRIPARTDIPAEARPHYMQSPRFKVMPVDWQRVADEGRAWLERWEKTVADTNKIRR